MILSQVNLCVNKSSRVFTCAYHTDMEGNEITKEVIDKLLIDNKGVYEMYAIYHDKDKVKSNHCKPHQLLSSIFIILSLNQFIH